MKLAARAAVALWLLALAVCGGWLYRHLAISTDLTVFLPPSATPSQQILIEQLRDGVAARLILIAIEGGEPRTLAQASKEVARGLRASGLFGAVNNGDLAGLEKERELLISHRYLLSPEVRAERFSVSGLNAALKESLELLASPAGALVKASLPMDPTGELREVLAGLLAGGGPETRHGVWFSRDGKRALLIAETLAPGFDADAQERAIRQIRQAFSAANLANARLLLSGTGVFAAQMRATIEGEAWRLSLVATGLVLAILFAVYRSFGTVAMSALPVASGLVAGITAVGLVFGKVHGITLGFGATLIGEAVDYPSYLFTQAARGERLSDTLFRIGPTLKLAVLTTVFGALAMALSSFQGLAQLGLLTIAGVAVAGLVTRWVLPAITPSRFVSRKVYALPLDAQQLAQVAGRGRWLAGALTVAALAVVIWRYDRLWDDELANLSPVPESAIAQDQMLRAELGAPDVRYLVVVRGENEEAALEKSEAVGAWLRQAVECGWISGFDLAANYLPSAKTQAERRASLPDAETLERNLREALQGLPFREGLFTPFLEAVARARSGPLLEIEDLRGTALALRVNALLFQSAGGWVALAPLRGVDAPRELAESAREKGYEFLDLKVEANALVNGYRNESLRLIGLGFLCIAGLLAWGLRSLTSCVRVLAPILAAVVVDVALLLLLGKKLSLFNLVALLLVVGIGLNYALFFNRPQSGDEEQRRTLLSLAVCSATTLSAFGALAFSETPVLNAIGITVTLGTVLSLLLAAALPKREETSRPSC
jgi:predicted exporter